MTTCSVICRANWAASSHNPRLTATMKTAATYTIHSKTRSFRLVISVGSITNFWYPTSPNKLAIVNAANERCVGGGGVDKAISEAGGLSLFKDRLLLPHKKADGDAATNVRCKTGDAVINGPNAYGNLKTSYVIHAVGPDYRFCEETQGDRKLLRAYRASLERAKEAKLEAVAFSLLSCGAYRGDKSVKELVRIGMKAIQSFHAYDELVEVRMCAFSWEDADALVEVAFEMGLSANPKLNKIV